MVLANGRPNHTHVEKVEIDEEEKKVRLQFDKDGNYKTEDEYESKVLRKYDGHPAFWRIKKDYHPERLEKYGRGRLYRMAKKHGWSTDYNISKKKKLLEYLKGINNEK